MTSFSGRGVRAGLLCLTACLALAGCKTTGKGMPEDEEKASSGFVNPFEDKPFKEQQAALPALPQDADLIPFSVNDSADNFRFAVDPKSISVGDDNVVRYTVVITSSGGGRNVSYEGLRCDAFERRIYATLPKGAPAWIPNQGEERDLWIRMQTRSRNAYAATLARDYFCDGRAVAGKPERLIRDLKAYAPRQAGP
ncbi:CNP1-like family protein [Cupriavidus agavae]|uniref:CNP1-like family protein n=1 Tax=Cupriavidus agavae TaxID=1001822 RepID=A0A4Q7S5Y8_9BURK|nr:CNP1-like family protein [Cupriavidus agavae]RZT41070.1 CNP1-like family protein [Cupriavidus agavae]